VGLNSQNILVKSFITGDRCVRFHLSSKINRFEWSSVLIYGTSQNTQKGEFLAKMVRICDDDSLPMLVGDFNIKRCHDEETNDN
jgi:hypothetical protein